MASDTFKQGGENTGFLLKGRDQKQGTSGGRQ
jgi:hypothetical protein